MKLGRFGAGAILIVGGSAVGGCTHLAVNRFSGQAEDAPRSGYAYMLDYTQYEVTVTRTLIDCPAKELPTIKIEATSVASLAPDGSQVYVINPESLISAFKTSDIAIEYKDGRLISFNATTEDKTADIIKSVAVTAGKIALLATGLPVPANGAGPAPVFGCSGSAIKKLEDKKADVNSLETNTAALEAGKSRLTDLTTRYAAEPSETLAKQVDAQKKAVEVAQKDVDELIKKIAGATAWLSRSKTVTWPETSAEFDSVPMLPLDDATISDWFDAGGLRTIIRDRLAQLKIKSDAATNTRRLDNDGASGNAARLGLTMDAFAIRYPLLVDPIFDPTKCDETSGSGSCQQLAAVKVAMVPDERLEAEIQKMRLNEVSFHLSPRGTYGSAKPAAVSARSDAGLRYRVPAASWLYVCEGVATCARPDEKKNQVLRLAGSTAQLGTVFYLPFSSPAFASGGVSMAFDDQGRLQKAGLKRSNAAALAAADSAGSIADQAAAYDKAKRSAPLAELNSDIAIAKAKKELADAEQALVKSPKAGLEEELGILEATRKLEEARALIGPSRTKELQNDIAITKLEVDLADQRKKLLADPNAGKAQVRALYEADTTVLNAQKARLEAEAAVDAAEKALAKAKKTP